MVVLHQFDLTRLDWHGVLVMDVVLGHHQEEEEPDEQDG